MENFEKYLDKETNLYYYYAVDIIIGNNKFSVPFNPEWKGIEPAIYFEDTSNLTLDFTDFDYIKDSDVLNYFFSPKYTEPTIGSFIIADFLGDDFYLQEKGDFLLNKKSEIPNKYKYLARYTFNVKDRKYKDNRGSYYITIQDILNLSSYPFCGSSDHKFKNLRFESGKVFNFKNLNKTRFHIKGYSGILIKGVRNPDLISYEEFEPLRTEIWFSNPINAKKFLKFLNPRISNFYIEKIRITEEVYLPGSDTFLLIRFRAVDNPNSFPVRYYN